MLYSPIASVVAKNISLSLYIFISTPGNGISVLFMIVPLVSKETQNALPFITASLGGVKSKL